MAAAERKVTRRGNGSSVPMGAPSGTWSSLSAMRGVSRPAAKTATIKLADTGTPHVVSLAMTLTSTLPRARSAGSAALDRTRSTTMALGASGSGDVTAVKAAVPLPAPATHTLTRLEKSRSFAAGLSTATEKLHAMVPAADVLSTRQRVEAAASRSVGGVAAIALSVTSAIDVDTDGASADTLRTASSITVSFTSAPGRASAAAPAAPSLTEPVALLMMKAPSARRSPVALARAAVTVWRTKRPSSGS